MITTYIAIGAGVVLLFGVWLAFRQARKRGEAEAKSRSHKRSAEHGREAREIEENVARYSDRELAKRLRKRSRK